MNRPKRLAKILNQVLSRTIFFPFTMAMALGYWVASDDDITYVESIKQVLKN